MTSKPVVLVWGATGAQGGSVARTILSSGDFAVRAATRTPESDAAKALAALGAQVVKADQHSDAEVNAASDGADAVFAVTNFWDPTSMGKEVEIANRLIAGAKKGGCKHFVWSTLPSASKISGGKFTDIKHFEDKASADAAVAAAGFEHHTFFRAAFYMENFASFFPPKPAEDGSGGVVFSLPHPRDSPLEVYPASQDTGDYVLEILRHPERFGSGAVVDGHSEKITPGEIVETYARVTGKKATYVAVDPKAFAKFGFPGAEELASMFEYFDEFGYTGPEGPQNSDICKGLTWEEYLRKTGWSG